MREKITIRRFGEKHRDKTDWARVDAMTEEELERAITSDPDADIPSIAWANARLVMPQKKKSLCIFESTLMS